MPKGVDEDLWQKAKAAARKAGAEDLYALTMHIYKGMGGAGAKEVLLGKHDAELALKIKKESLTSTANAQLLRGKECDGKCKTCSHCQEFGGRFGTPRIFTPLTEAAFVEGKREATVTVITEGPGNARDCNYYSDQAIESIIPLLDGAPCMIDHATETERAERGEGSLWVQCGYYKNPRMEDRGGRKAAVAELVFDESSAGNFGLAKAKAAVQHAKDCPGARKVFAGFSVNGGGRPDGEVDIQGMTYNNIVEFTELDSADMVTRPARGGRAESVRESQTQETETEMNKLKKSFESIAKFIGLVAKSDKPELKKAAEAAKAEMDKANKLLVEAETEAAETETETETESETEAEVEGEEQELSPVEKLKAMVQQGADEAEEAYAARCSDALAKIVGKPAEKKPAAAESDKGELARLRGYEKTQKARETADKLMDEFKVAAPARKDISEHLVLNLDGEPAMRAYLKACKAQESAGLFGSPERGAASGGSVDSVLEECGVEVNEDEK